MATHSSVPAWRIPGMGEPGGLLSVGSHRVRHDRSDSAAASIISLWAIYRAFLVTQQAMQEMQVWSLGGKTPWRRKWQPTPVFLPGKSHGQRSLEGYSPWGRQRVRRELVAEQQQKLLTNGSHICLVQWLAHHVYYYTLLLNEFDGNRQGDKGTERQTGEKAFLAQWYMTRRVSNKQWAWWFKHSKPPAYECVPFWVWVCKFNLFKGPIKLAYISS